MAEKLEKYLDSFRRLYFQGEHETEKGRGILERKARVLNLNEQDCKEAVDSLLSRYTEYAGLLIDLQRHGDIQENDMLELNEFQVDLALTDEEVRFLSMRFMQDDAERTATVERAQEARELPSPVGEGNACPEILPSGAELLTMLDTFIQDKESDAFFHLYISQALAAKEIFISVLGDITSARQISGDLLLRLYHKSFEGFVKMTHGAMVHGGFEGTPEESLWTFLDPGAVRSIGNEFAQLVLGMEEILEADRLQRRTRRGSSTRIAVGSLGFMAAMGVIGAAGKGLRSIGDAVGNGRLASKLGGRALAGFRSAIAAIEDVIDLGLERLYDAIAVSLGMRGYSDIQQDLVAAQNVLQTYESLKQRDRQLYGAKVLAALRHNPYNARAYSELADCVADDIEQEMAVLRRGIERVLFSSDKQILQARVTELEHACSVSNLTEANYDQIAATAKPLQQLASSITLHLKPNQFAPIEEDDEQLLRLVSVVDRYNGENLDPVAVLACGSFPKSDWLFTYTRLYALYDGKLVSAYYQDIQDCGVSGWTNTYVKLKLPDGVHEVPMTGNSTPAVTEPVLQFMKTARGQVTAFLAGLRCNDTIITQALQLSHVQADNLIAQALERAGSDRALARLQYVEPSEFYRRTWEEINIDGYPAPEQLEKLAAVGDELELKPDHILELQRPLLDRYYEEELHSIARLEPQDLKNTLLSIRSKYHVRDAQAMLAERMHFGKTITVASGKACFVEEALALFDQRGTNPFGNRLFRTGAIPADKLTNAQAKYLKCSNDEILLFLYDDTVFGSAKDGLAITDRAIYCSSSKAMAFSSMLTTKLKSSSLIIGGKDGELEAALSMMSDARHAFLDFVTQLARTHKRIRAEFGDW